MRSRHLSRVVHRAPQDVYAVAADPDNLPRWAAGLATGRIEHHGEVLVVHSPMGRVTVRFAPRNELGVLDHQVTLPSGVTVDNPMRVVGHPQGAEVVFTLRQGDLSDEEFERDARMVEDDLDRLRALLER